MDNLIPTLISILELANRIDNKEIAKETIIALSKEYGLRPSVDLPKRLEDIILYAPMTRKNRLRMVKEMFERAKEYGFGISLKEAKDEVDRRYAILDNH